MGALGVHTNKYTLLTPSSNDSEDPYAGGPKQPSRPSNQQEAGHEPVRHIYLADAGTSRTGVKKYLLHSIRLLNVDNDTAGIASWLDRQGTVAELALFERHEVHNPLHPGLKLVGVYPVIGGWALINLQQVAGKGQASGSPLYVMLGSERMKWFGLGLQRQAQLSQMAALGICTFQNARLPHLIANSQELGAAESVQLSKAGSQQEAGHDVVSHVYLADASPSQGDVKRCNFRDKCLLNIDHNAAGLAKWLDWEGTIAEIAIFERRDLDDPEYPRLKPVGEYPVKNGWACIKVEEVAGKGQYVDCPLYATPGGPWMKLLGLGLQRKLDSLIFVK